MTDTPPPLLQVSGLTLSYPMQGVSVPVVRDISLTLHAGETLGIAGESGCGKSSLAYALLRELRGGSIDKGEVLFKGHNVLKMTGPALRQLRSANIAMVQQDPGAALNPSMRIGAQLTEVLTQLHGIGKEEATRKCASMLDSLRLSGPKSIMAAWPHQLSGGQRQRVLIAMALLSDPEVLILDEPTTGLDAQTQAEIVSLLRTQSAHRNIATLFISHDLALIGQSCDRIAIMYAGAFIETGAASDVLNQPSHPYTKALLNAQPQPENHRGTAPLKTIPGAPPTAAHWPPGCTFAPRCSYARPEICDRNEPALQPDKSNSARLTACIRYDAIKEDLLRDEFADSDNPIATRDGIQAPDPLISVRNISKTYSSSRKRTGVAASNNISLDVFAGETLAIIGESGSGKSTLAKLISGLETADSGSINFHNKDLSQLPARKRPRSLLRQIQMVFQNPASTLNPAHTIGYQLQRTLKLRESTSAADADLADPAALLRAVRLEPSIANALPGNLSGGQKQRVAIARALAANPGILIADEPVSALDVSVQAAIVELLLSLQRQYSLTLLFISHDIALVRYIADRVAVIYKGEIVDQGDVADVMSNPTHSYSRSLFSAALM